MDYDPLSVTIFPSLTEQTRQGIMADPLSQVPTITSHFVIFRKDHKLKVALFWAACDIYSKIIQKIISTDELKYTVSQFDISQMLIF